ACPGAVNSSKSYWYRRLSSAPGFPRPRFPGFSRWWRRRSLPRLLMSFDVADVAYGNYKDGLSFEGNATANPLYNSIVVENGLTTNEFDLWVDGPSSSRLRVERQHLLEFNESATRETQHPPRFVGGRLQRGERPRFADQAGKPSVRGSGAGGL